jgi:mRNA interferase MazF
MVLDEVKRGEIFYATLNPVIGSEQGGLRPVLILQNDVGNQYSPTTIIAAITGQMLKSKMPTHVELPAVACGLEKDSIVLTEQIRTIDKRRLKEKIARLSSGYMNLVDQALEISLGLKKLS